MTSLTLKHQAAQASLGTKRSWCAVSMSKSYLDCTQPSSLQIVAPFATRNLEAGT